ncbi:hypothetical protein PVK06_039909 [Gossypium arboreum]|uniref:Ditrans,polycis-polyprenyl diphosphate synthase ((2E,6E)-farnesyldiphosphate specific) n=1 Tax=Gossypium arboreum TaxID=29729 RepID=A0ABR0N693_GOSAR|nr:hypothetical protein PVK06_039909 [Gossypium arboreum]
MDGSCLNFKYLLRFEKHYGQMTNGSLCVTRAMQLELAQNWGIRATVLYDQPPEFFCPTSLQEKRKVDTDILLKRNRPALVVSSISW